MTDIPLYKHGYYCDGLDGGFSRLYSSRQGLVRSETGSEVVRMDKSTNVTRMA